MILSVREFSSEETERVRAEWKRIHATTRPGEVVILSPGDAELLHVETKPTEQVEAEHKINFREFL